MRERLSARDWVMGTGKPINRAFARSEVGDTVPDEEGKRGCRRGPRQDNVSAGRWRWPRRQGAVAELLGTTDARSSRFQRQINRGAGQAMIEHGAAAKPS